MGGKVAFRIVSFDRQVPATQGGSPLWLDRNAPLNVADPVPRPTAGRLSLLLRPSHDRHVPHRFAGAGGRAVRAGVLRRAAVRAEQDQLRHVAALLGAQPSQLRLHHRLSPFRTSCARSRKPATGPACSARTTASTASRCPRYGTNWTTSAWATTTTIRSIKRSFDAFELEADHEYNITGRLASETIELHRASRSRGSRSSRG